MYRIEEMIGAERPLRDVSEALRQAILQMDPLVVGAHQLNCSDESERECVEIFHRVVVRDLLPELKFWSQSSFRTVNLGARYERGSTPLAEDHFATAASADGFKVLLVKINAHVSVNDDGEVLTFGRRDRYDRESVYCGALHALLDGGQGDFVDELRRAFARDGVDRIGVLNDPKRMPPGQRALAAALVSARLQAERALEDIQGHASATTTVYLVVPCVTINRAEDDTEIVVGLYTVDERGGSQQRSYVGLGDDPARYRIECRLGAVHVTEP